MKKKSIFLIFIVLVFTTFSLFALDTTSSASQTNVKTPSANDNSEVLADAFNEVVEKNEWPLYSAISNGSEYKVTYDQLTRLDEDLSLSGTLIVKPTTKGKKSTLDITFSGILSAIDDGYKYDSVPFSLSFTMNAKMDSKGKWDESSAKVNNASFGSYQISLSKVAKELDL